MTRELIHLELHLQWLTNEVHVLIKHTTTIDLSVTQSHILNSEHETLVAKINLI